MAHEIYRSSDTLILFEEPCYDLSLSLSFSACRVLTNENFSMAEVLNLWVTVTQKWVAKWVTRASTCWYIVVRK